MTIQEINRNTPEGRLLITAIGLIATDLRTDKSASDILNILEKRYRAIDFVDAELNRIKKVKVLVKVIIANSSHPLRVGDHIILDKYDSYRKMYGVDTSEGYIWIHESELEVIQQYYSEDKEKKFEEGAKAIITGNETNHRFEIGQEVILISFGTESWLCGDGISTWRVAESEMKLI